MTIPQSDAISSERRTLFREVSSAVAAAAGTTSSSAVRAPSSREPPPRATATAAAGSLAAPLPLPIQSSLPIPLPLPPSSSSVSAEPTVIGGLEIPKSLAEIYGLSNINRRNRNKEKKRNRASGEGSLRASDGSDAVADHSKSRASTAAGGEGGVSAGAADLESEVEEFYFGSAGNDHSAVGSTIDETVSVSQ